MNESSTSTQHLSWRIKKLLWGIVISRVQKISSSKSKDETSQQYLYLRRAISRFGQDIFDGSQYFNLK